MSVIIFSSTDLGDLSVTATSTLANWDLEFEKWAPGIIRVAYKGNPQRRKFLYNNHIQHGKFNVVITTYEYVAQHKKRWQKATI